MVGAKAIAKAQPFKIWSSKTPDFKCVRTLNGRISIPTIFGYSNHLKTRLVWYSNGRFVSGCQMVWYLNGSLKTGLKKPVYGPLCLVFKWSDESCDFTIWIPDTHTVCYSDVRYSDGYCIVLYLMLERLKITPNQSAKDFKGQGLIMLAFIKTFSIVRHWNSNSISQVWRSTTLDQRAPLSLPQSRCRRRRRKRRNSDSTASSSSGFCRQIFLPSVVPEIRNRRPTLDCREPKIGNSTQTR